jgi:hypothetical protein
MIEPAQLRELLSYDPETGDLTWLPRGEEMFSRRRSWLMWNTRFAGKPAFRTACHGYWAGLVFRKKFKAHRVAWALHYGRWPTAVIDHINGDPLDNRIGNLRDVEQSENLKNMRIKRAHSSGVLGVYRNYNRWVAHIGRTRIGFFATRDEAVSARKAAERAHGYHPEHGLMNRIPTLANQAERTRLLDGG